MNEFDVKEFERKKAEVKKEWSRLYTEKGNLLYEGMVYNDKPCGAGTVYFENGNVYQEGVFGIKGLSSGREYYPDGTLRFEGLYRLNYAYGPNYPEYGHFFDENGKCVIEGMIEVKRGGVGYPVEIINTPIKRVIQENCPEVHWLMWHDL